LEVALSQLWEGLFGRRKPATMKTREASRDNEHKEDVVPRLMFKTLCEGVRRKVRHGHCCRRPPPAAVGRRRPPPENEARPVWSLLSSSSDGASPRDVARTMATTERGIHL
jgi:hypothetical protein